MFRLDDEVVVINQKDNNVGRVGIVHRVDFRDNNNLPYLLIFGDNTLCWYEDSELNYNMKR